MLSRTSRILLVAAVLAVGAYLVIDRKTEEPGDDDEPARLAAFDIARVDGVILERESDTLRFAREDSLWRMTGPLSDVAEPSTVISLLDALERADIARNLGATDDLAPFGLAPPQVRVTLLARADTLVRADLGKRTVDDAWCYARAGTRGDLLLVPTDIARAASLPRDDYRDHRVVDFQLRDIAKYSVVGNDGRMVWSRDERGWISIPLPPHDAAVRGDSVAVESVLRRLRGLRAASFIAAADSNRLSAGGSLGVVTLYRATPTSGAMSDSPLEVLSVFREANGSIVTRRHRGAVRIHDDLGDLFQLTTTDLRDRRLLQFSPADAERIEVALPDASGTIVRSGGSWSFPNPALGRIDADRAADFVRALRALKWTDVGPHTTPGLASSRFSVTVTAAGGTILDEMRVDSRPDGRWLVTSHSSRGVWMIEHELVAALADRFARLTAP